MQRTRLLACLGLLALAVACASPRHVSATASDSVLRVTAFPFSFEPDEIKANKGQTLSMDVVNSSDREHNITIDDPDGNEILSRNIPAGETARVTLRLERPGVYEFYCAKPFHPSLGMTGRIVAE